MYWPGLWQKLRGSWKVLFSLSPLSHGLIEPGRVPAASLRVSYCRCGRSFPHLSGPAALGPLDRYTLLSGLALRSPEDRNCSQDNLLGSVEIPVGPRGTVLSWEAFLLLSTRLPTG